MNPNAFTPNAFAYGSALFFLPLIHVGYSIKLWSFNVCQIQPKCGVIWQALYALRSTVLSVLNQSPNIWISFLSPSALNQVLNWPSASFGDVSVLMTIGSRWLNTTFLQTVQLCAPILRMLTPCVLLTVSK